MTTGSTFEGGVGTVARGAAFTGSTGTSTAGAFVRVPPHEDSGAAARPANMPRTAARTSGEAGTPRGYQNPGLSMTRGSPACGVVGDVVGAVVGAIVGDVEGADGEDDESSVVGALGVAVLGVDGVDVPAHGCAGVSSSVVAEVFAFAFDGEGVVDVEGIAGPEPNAGPAAFGFAFASAFAFAVAFGRSDVVASAGAALCGFDSVISMSPSFVVTGFASDGRGIAPSSAGGGVMTVVSMRPLVTSVRESGSIFPSSDGGAVPVHCGSSPALYK